MNSNTETSPHACKMRVTQQSAERGLSHQSCWATKSRWWVRMVFFFFFFQHFIRNHKATVWDLGFKAKIVSLKRVLMISSWVSPVLASPWPYWDDADSLIQLFFIDESRSYVAANFSAQYVSHEQTSRLMENFRCVFIIEMSTIWCQRKKKLSLTEVLWVSCDFDTIEGERMRIFKIITGEPVVIVGVGSTRL